MNRKTWEAFDKYGGYLDPEENVFFGPITKRELLRSMEVADERIKTIRRRKQAQATKAALEAVQNASENSSADRTFEKAADRTFEKAADRTFEKVDEENIDTESENAELNRTYELDESQNPYMCPLIETKENHCDKNEISTLNSNKTMYENDYQDNRPHLISILCDPLKDVSNLNESLSKTKITSDKPNSSPISAKASRKSSVLKKGSLLDDTCSTIVTGCLQTPLLEKLRKTGPAPDSSKGNLSLDKTLTNENSVCGTAERFTKLSDTFITELLPENCLINSSLSESTRQRTPDVFRQKRNEIWHKNSPAKKSVGAPLLSKLPLLKKTPNTKFLPGKSPVADYIHRGISVKSASKIRHSYCLSDTHLQPKSDQKGGKSCKIPVATNAFAKRKLQMGETKLPGLKN